MQTINVRDTREQLAHLLDAVAGGEEIVIVRRGKPAARLVPVTTPQPCFPDRSDLRSALPPMQQPASQMVRELRDAERY